MPGFGSSPLFLRILKKFVLPNVILLTLASLFLLLSRFAPFRYLVVCPMHYFGLYCPTCGMTRASRALLSFDLAASFSYHPLLPLFVLTVAYYDLALLCSAIRARPVLRHPRRMLYLTIAAFLVFFVVRNVLLLVFGIDPVGDFIK